MGFDNPFKYPAPGSIPTMPNEGIVPSAVSQQRRAAFDAMYKNSAPTPAPRPEGAGEVSTISIPQYPADTPSPPIERAPGGFSSPAEAAAFRNAMSPEGAASSAAPGATASAGWGALGSAAKTVLPMALLLGAMGGKKKGGSSMEPLLMAMMLPRIMSGFQGV